MTRRTTAVPITVLLALLAVGCSDDDTATDPLTTSSTSKSESASTTTTVPPLTTSTSAAASPTTSPLTTTTPTTEPVLTAPPTATAAPTTPPPAAEDWVAIVQALENTRTALYEAPDPARAVEICASGSPCVEQYQAQFADMVNDGHRVVDSPPQDVVSAEVVPNSFEGASIDESIVVSVDVVFRIPDGAAGRIVDASGATVFDLTYTPPPGQTYATRLTLFRPTPADPWRESFHEEIP